MLTEGAPRHCVLADAGYGVDTAFCWALSDMGLKYAVGVTAAVVVWPSGIAPLPPKRHSGNGRPPVMLTRTARLQPMSVKALALVLPAQAFQTISWREDTNEPISRRVAAVRVRHAGVNAGKARLRSLQWLLIEWPAGQAEPIKYISSTMPEETPLDELVGAMHQRLRIERDCQDLKRDFGLGHYKGRGWREFHHHASPNIAAYRFLMAERLTADKSVGGKKTSSNATCLPFPRITFPEAALRAQRHVRRSITALRLDYAPIARLGPCPCYGRTSLNAKLLL